MRYAAMALMIGVFLLACSDTQSFANPGLANCRVCGDKVAKEATACPHCGAPKPFEGETLTTWHENGKKRSEGLARNGKPVGPWTSWYENGKKKSEGHFKDGKLDGPYASWLKDGTKDEKGYFKDGKKEGLWIVWNGNGTKWKEEHYKNDKRHGVFTVWDDKGNKISHPHWINGNLVDIKIAR